MGLGLSAQSDHNYAEALQKALYFYDAEKCGVGISDQRLEWRGDCHVQDAAMPISGETTNLSPDLLTQYKDVFDPDGDGFIDVSGGYHDAGDHVKFGLPQTYATSTLEWAFYEFRESFEAIGEAEHIKEILRWGADYYLRSTFLNEEGEVIAFCYQVGEGSVDHNYWGPPELQMPEKYGRPAYFATAENPASDQASGAAASLAVTYLNFIDEDPVYANECLTKAKALYKFATLYRGTGYDGGFYNSSFDEDELSWAAVWLNIATGEESYLNDIISVSESGQYTGWLKKIIASVQDNWQNIWVHSWDTKWGGVFAKLASVTNDPQHWYIFRWNLEYWSGIEHEDSGDDAYLQKTNAGFSFLNAWGSARYNAAAQFQALVYRKYSQREDFADWAKGQMDYILGDNPMSRSYLVGYGEEHAMHPHHRAAHGSSTNSTLTPENHAHTLWGALVGGPDAADKHKDATSDYVYNEVAIDYNAGAVGALAGHYYFYGEGDEPVADFPPKEPEVKEYFAEAKIEQANSERSQLSLKVNNKTIHPPKMHENISARYFFNISELVAHGQSIDDVEFDVFYDETVFDGGETGVSGPHVWNLAQNIYYMEFDWAGLNYYGSKTIQFALIAPQDATWSSHWDGGNDFSFQNLSDEDMLATDNIPVYIDGELFSGNVPPKGGDTAPVAQISASATSGVAPLTVTLSAKKSIDPDGDTIVYLWTLPDGTTSDQEEIEVTLNEVGAYEISLAVTDDTGLSNETTIQLVADEEGGTTTCNLFTLFNVPSATPLAGTDQHSEFTKVHVINDGPDLSNITSLSMNWDLQNNGLYQFAMYTNNGTPDWYMDLSGLMTQTLNQPSPEMTIAGSGFEGLDNTYLANWVGDALALVQKDGDYAIVFNNSDEVPSCSQLKGKSLTVKNNAKVTLMPNPASDMITIRNADDIAKIKIINTAGVVVRKRVVSEQSSVQFNVSQLPSGVYHVICTEKSGKTRQNRFIKE